MTQECQLEQEQLRESGVEKIKYYVWKSNSEGAYFHLNESFITFLEDNGFTIYDSFEVSYTGTFTEKVDLGSNLLLLMQDSTNGDNWIPLDSVEIDTLGFFEYERSFKCF